VHAQVGFCPFRSHISSSSICSCFEVRLTSVLSAFQVTVLLRFDSISVPVFQAPLFSSQFDPQRSRSLFVPVKFALLQVSFLFGCARFQPSLPVFADVTESLHKLADSSDAAEFEGFKSPPSTSPDTAVSSEPFLRHRLCSRLAFWKTVYTSAFVLEIITAGYALP
jgi:hypothetical protein